MQWPLAVGRRNGVGLEGKGRGGHTRPDADLQSFKSTCTGLLICKKVGAAPYEVLGVLDMATIGGSDKAGRLDTL